MTTAAAAIDVSADPSLSLYHLMDQEVLADPYPLYRRIRERDPVHWDPFLHTWVVTRYEDVLNVLHKFSADRTPTPEYFEALGAPEVAPVAKLMVQQMLFLDGSAHARLRGLAAPAFTPVKVRRLRDRVAAISERLIDDILARHGTSGTFDLMAEFAEPLPAIVTADMLGVPEEDHPQLKDWSVSFAEMLGNFQHNPDRLGGVLQAVEGMTAYFGEAVARQRVEPREGLIRDLLMAELDGDRLTEGEVVANTIIVMVGGLETTTNLIGNGMLALTRHPGEMARLRGDSSLVPSAVEELLRFESPSQHTGRIVPADLTLGGKSLKKGQAVLAVMGAANRDPARFPDPDRLDLSRPDNRHLAFGWAAHFCFGAPLARLEGQVAFEALLRRFGVLEFAGGPLTWRANLGLRGLESLPLNYQQKAPS
ncbi:MAG: cytochrome P450 [Thermoleophilia bacterium]|nr:cytochrome P450 [Thermoleophilia bacterium]